MRAVKRAVTRKTQSGAISQLLGFQMKSTKQFFHDWCKKPFQPECAATRVWRSCLKQKGQVCWKLQKTSGTTLHNYVHFVALGKWIDPKRKRLREKREPETRTTVREREGRTKQRNAQSKKKKNVKWYAERINLKDEEGGKWEDEGMG